jgi:hypothetical protein
MNKILVGGVAIAVAVGGVMAWKKHKREVTEQARLEAIAKERQASIDKARSLVIGVLKDPGSVQFRGQQWHPESKTLCGELNAKNSMGGYVGYKKFVATQQGYLLEGASLRTLDISQYQMPNYIAEGIALVDGRDDRTDLALGIFVEIYKKACEGNSESV